MRDNIAHRLNAIDIAHGHLFGIKVANDGERHTEPRTASLSEGEGGELLIHFSASGWVFNEFIGYAQDILADYETIPGDGDGLALVVLPSPSLTLENIED